MSATTRNLALLLALVAAMAGPAAAQVQQPSTSPRAGTGGDLVLQTLVNGVGDAADTYKDAVGGDRLFFGVYAPGQSLERAPFLLVQLHRSGALLPSPFPGISIAPDQDSAVVALQAGERFPAADVHGFRGALDIPADLAGFSLLMQGFAISPLARNGMFESTDAHEVVLY